MEKFEKKFVFCYTLIEKSLVKNYFKTEESFLYIFYFASLLVACNLKIMWLSGKFIMKLFQNRDIKLKL